MKMTPRIISFLLFIVSASFRLLAEDAIWLNLGSGEASLHIIYDTNNRYVIYLNEPWTVGKWDVHSGGYAIDPTQRGYRKRQIILKCGNVWESDPQELYPFDEQTAFTCRGGDGWTSDYKVYNYWPRKTRVFCTKVDGLLVFEDVYALAHSRYGLKTNQLFLGKIRTNVFYWETQDPSKVYYRGAEEKQALNYFKLPKAVFDLYGVTKAVNTNKDVGIWTGRRSPGWFNWICPNEDAVFEVSLKNAKHLKGNQ